MNSRWRWETIASVACLAPVGIWAFAFAAPPDAFWAVGLAVAVGAGLVLGFSGAQRGSSSSRSVAQGCVLLHLVLGALLLPAMMRTR